MTRFLVGLLIIAVVIGIPCFFWLLHKLFDAPPDFRR